MAQSWIGKGCAVLALAATAASKGLLAPCYGYGEIMGVPSKYLADDLDKVSELKVGQGKVYVSNINYLFEGKDFLQIGYRDVDDEDFREFSWPHGGDNVSAKRFNLLDQDSRILNIGWIHNLTKERMIAFMFVEHKRLGYDDRPWVLTAFNPRGVPYYEFVDEVPGTLKQVETFQWNVEAAIGECSMLGNVPLTQLVGFATTKITEHDDGIQSLQPIYFSYDQNMCDCLGENPVMSRNTVRVQDHPNENFFDRLQREGNLETFVNLVGFGILFIVVVSILVCVLCYFSKKQPRKVQMSYNSEVYSDLCVRAEQRVYLMEQAIAFVKKNGYSKDVNFSNQGRLGVGAKEAGQMIGGMLSQITGKLDIE